MNFLATHHETRTIYRLLQDTMGKDWSGTPLEIPDQGINNQTYLLRDAGLVIKVRPQSGGPASTPCPHWPQYTCSLLGYTPNGGVRSLVEVTRLLDAHGGLRVPLIHTYGEGTGPEGTDFTLGEILPGTPYNWDTHPLSSRASRQLGEHLGKLHRATARTSGFGIFDGPAVDGGEWWPCFAESYRQLATEVCDLVPRLDGHAFRAALERAERSEPPESFPLVCIDQNPTHYLGDAEGRITGFVDVEGHLWAPAEWELSTVLMWIRDPLAFRKGYESFQPWPSAMKEVQAAYTCYTFLEWIFCVRTMTDRPWEADELEEPLMAAAKGAA